MTRLLSAVLATASSLAFATSAGAQLSNPYELSLDDFKVEACTAEMGLASGLHGVTADNFTEVVGEYVEARASLSGAFARSDAGQAFRQAIRDRRNQFKRQVVYLEFNDANPNFNVFQRDAEGNLVPFAGGVFPDFIYSEEDKQEVLQRMRTDYAGFRINFTLTEPAQGDYSTIRIAANDDNPIVIGGGILFGVADNIDFGNDDRNDTAFADPSFWQLLAELDSNFGTQNLANFLGLEEPLTTQEEIDAVRRELIINQSANTGAHELGHILGLRHHDSIGKPGDGLPPARTEGGVPAIDPLDFIPAVEFDQNAVETFDHIMASGASVGINLLDSGVADRFFGEREAGKLWVNTFRFERPEATFSPFFPFAFLRPSRIPNPLEMGVNAGKRLLLEQNVITGAISEFGEEDDYIFFLREGQVFNAETISSSDITIEDDIWAKLALSKINADGTEEVVAENQVTFEGREPLIFDFTIPSTGFYTLTVSAPDSVPVGRDENGEPIFVNLSDFQLNEEQTFFDVFGTGDYDLYAYTVKGQERRRTRRFAWNW